MAAPPNILFLFTDQQRFDTIHALGNAVIRTPALDRLVREGTSFTRAYTPSPVCMSARCSLTTGLPPHVTGVADNTGMPEGLPSMMEHLQSAGYQTHGVGKMHFEPDYRRLWGFESRDVSEECKQTDYHHFLRENGFGHVLEPNGMRSEYYYLPQPSQLPSGLCESSWVTDRSLDFLQRRDRTRPFFLWTSYIKPHPPFESPAPWSKLYRAAEMDRPFRPEGEDELLNLWNRLQNRYKYRDAGTDDLLMRTLRAAYYACISFLDCQIGRLLAALPPEELDNTLIVFSSDHGELLGDYNSVGKRGMLDAACRIPLIARWPGHFAAGATCERLATLLDIFPTFAQAAGRPNTPSPEGVSLRDLAQGSTSRQYVFSQFSTKSTGLYLTMDQRWKYIYSAGDEKEWLFHAKTDPRETRNQAQNPEAQDDLKRLRQVSWERFRQAGYTAVLDDAGWRKFGPRSLPDDPDYGLLFQDPANLQEQIDALGPEYARPATAHGEEGYRIVLDFMEPHEEQA